MAKRIDPLNKKGYGAVTAILVVSDIKASVNFYSKAFGFAKRGIMNGPDKKPMHAELTLRGTTLMLGPEGMGGRSAKTIGGSPVTLYLTSENVDKTVAKAVKLGATLSAPVMDMFWGDRVGNIIDPNGQPWMIATHIAEPSSQEMMSAMKRMTTQQQQAGGAAGA